jgi:hypothetical protein
LTAQVHCRTFNPSRGTALVTEAQVRDIVTEILRERVPKIKVARVNVRMGEDEDGDKIMVIKVIFEAKPNEFKPEQLSGVPREIIAKLNEADDDTFPVISFIEKSDLGNTKPETV